MKRITKDWMLAAESDLQLINEILEIESLTHLAAFHAQQVIEKSFKALIEEFGLGLQKTHSLELLYNKVADKLSVNIQSDLLILLDQLYIDSRYPGELGLFPNGKPSLLEAKEFYNLAKYLLDAAKTVCS